MTQEELKIFSPATPEGLTPIVTDWFNKYADQFQVNTPLRIAAFLSQVMVESNSFKALREYASGAAYEGREDLGNLYPGDGKKFKGRGYIMITGRTNYAALSMFIFKDTKTLLDNPDLLATPQYAMIAAFWFWSTRNLNVLADKQFVETITKRINGGLNDFAARVENYNRICEHYGLLQYDIDKRTVKTK